MPTDCDCTLGTKVLELFELDGAAEISISTEGLKLLALGITTEEVFELLLVLDVTTEE
ncbi:hypothetical protein FACS189472_12400 [Alphaproteobacteria bacterium]|nr:hypothetical protein FACS189472_12400 [Alphaproteobacteria bacterium]